MRRGIRSRALVLAVAAATFGSGLINLIFALSGPVRFAHPDLARNVFPLEFDGLSKSILMLAGFALVVSSGQILNRKRRALQVVASIGAAAAVFHSLAGLGKFETISSLGVIGLLFAARREFNVGSGPYRLGAAITQASAGLIAALCYGLAGYWLMEPREFGINFRWWQAVLRSFQLFSFSGPAPQTPYAEWYLDSLHLMAASALVYAVAVLYRPVRYRFNPPATHDRERAAQIVTRYGRSAQDFFKQWDDKSFFFSRSGNCFLGYRVARAYAIVLGDPVGPEHEIEQAAWEFLHFCQSKGWRCGFHQVHPDRLAIYKRLGFRHLKIGDDAVVDLTTFSLQGKGMKEFRNTVSKFERLGARVTRYEPELPAELIAELKAVSDEWLGLPGRRERRFTLGRFEAEYVRSTPVYVVEDMEGHILAFLNLIPCYSSGLASLDLMRRRRSAPNGAMDFLMAKVFLDLKTRGVERFSLGMAPSTGSRNDGGPVEEHLAHSMIPRMNFLFSYEGLRQYKSKYASAWEPRYSAYRSVLDLPRLAMALRIVAEFGRGEERAA